ncbi:trypsin-like peptidase domain-containing protein [Paractinoplanes atraurantiacus]|uniref:Trypsin-like peptidase domain-containing protein n=1 Tax=Paractinoplanes atraurantiacus TaxID=1036182 RepID=A0A285IXR5_9ACTN|nr:trypsin-like peptidase domain-containing protein [Actinoplanes atraurantiacus]SNY52487.1 Trypsin-like peptidase domain-containing protein [Actinoplanes atraurantiacus]
MTMSRPLSRLRAAVLASAASAVLLVSAVPAAGAPSPPGPGGPLPPVTPQLRAIELVQPAIVMVRSDWDLDVHLFGLTVRVPYTGSCSGFIVNGTGYVVTAGHCTSPEDARDYAVESAVDVLIEEDIIAASFRDEAIEDATTGNARITEHNSSAAPEPEMQVQVGGGVATWPRERDAKGGVDARVLESLPFAKGDVALLKLESSTLPAAQLAGDQEVQPGQEVLVIGYPFHLTDGEKISLSNRSGEISSVDTQGIHGPGNRFYEVSAKVTQGQSGGPAVNLDGQVVGTASFEIVGETNFIVPADVIRDLLAKHQVRNELGAIDTTYRAGLDDFYRGYYTDAIAKFDQVLAMMPAHHLASQKRKQAVEYRQRHGDQAKPTAAAEPASRSRLLIIGAAAAALLIAVAVVVWLLMRRRTGKHRSSQIYRGTTAIGVLPADTAVIGRVVIPDRARCSRCGSPYEPEALFCSSCGNQLTGAEPADPNTGGVTSAPLY